MNREEIRGLLGGYATGTLTSEEQQALFEAALEDQELFNAIAREESLRDLLSDPAARAHLLTALDGARVPKKASRFSRWFLHPATLGAAAAGLVLVSGLMVWRAKEGENRAKQSLEIVVAEAKRNLQAQLNERPRAGTQQTALETAQPRKPAKLNIRRPAEGARPQMAKTAARPEAKAAGAFQPSPAASSASARMAAPGQTGATGGVLGGVAGAMPVNGFLREQTGASAPRAPGLQSGASGRQFAFNRFVAARGEAALPTVATTVLLRDAAGRLVKADPEELHAGDAVVLQFVPSADGSLTLFDMTDGEQVRKPLLTVQLQRGRPFETGLPAGDVGRREYAAVFMGSSPPSAIVRTTAAQEREAPASAPSPQAAMKIILNYK